MTRAQYTSPTHHRRKEDEEYNQQRQQEEKEAVYKQAPVARHCCLPLDADEADNIQLI